MKFNKPKVSIGLPVFNGENFLRQALESILSQTFEDFEVIISDNASNDGTEKICRKYMYKDRRIKYHRNRINLGAAQNYNKVFRLSHGEYFKWAAHDDELHPDFLKVCLESILKNKSIVLSFPKTYRINSKSNITGSYSIPMKCHSYNVRERFRDLIIVRHSCVAIFGIIRSSVLSKTPLIGGYFGSDRNLLAELGLYGRLIEIPEYLLYRRDHPDASVRKFSFRDRIKWFTSINPRTPTYPYWRILKEYICALNRVPISLSDKLKCYRYICEWILREHRSLGSDLKNNIRIKK